MFRSFVFSGVLARPITFSFPQHDRPPKDSEVLDPTNDVDKEKIRLQEKNLETYQALILSLDDEISIGVLESTTTADLPEGDAKLAQEKHLEIYQPVPEEIILANLASRECN